MNNPPTTSEKVTRVCLINVPSSIESINLLQTEPGDGRINSGTAEYLVIPSQIKKITSKITGTERR
jgi:hypothetical protein